jgi:hypothetical protein
MCLTGDPHHVVCAGCLVEYGESSGNIVSGFEKQIAVPELEQIVSASRGFNIIDHRDGEHARWRREPDERRGREEGADRCREGETRARTPSESFWPTIARADHVAGRMVVAPAQARRSTGLWHRRTGRHPLASRIELPLLPRIHRPIPKLRHGSAGPHEDSGVAGRQRLGRQLDDALVR